MKKRDITGTSKESRGLFPFCVKIQSGVFLSPVHSLWISFRLGLYAYSFSFSFHSYLSIDALLLILKSKKNTYNSALCWKNDHIYSKHMNIRQKETTQQNNRLRPEQEEEFVLESSLPLFLIEKIHKKRPDQVVGEEDDEKKGGRTSIKAHFLKFWDPIEVRIEIHKTVFFRVPFQFSTRIWQKRRTEFDTVKGEYGEKKKERKKEKRKQQLQQRITQVGKKEKRGGWSSAKLKKGKCRSEIARIEKNKTG